MPAYSTSLWSSVGRKAMMALTGLGLVAFVTVHLIGNLILLKGDADAFNIYAHFYMKLGGALYVIEAGLVAVFLVHIVSAIRVYLSKRKARPQNYIKKADAGGKSRKTVSSVSMIFTGLTLLVFLVIHLLNFKYGPHYSTLVEGVEMRDLYRVVIDTYAQPLWTGFYVFCMVLLGFHLRHGFWSAFQSLGVLQPRCSNFIYGLGVAIALLLAFGFVIIPIWIFLNS